MATSIQKAVANALSFAHLASLRGRAKASDSDKDDETDDDKKSKAKADDDKPDDDDGKEKKDAKADDDDPDATAEDDKPEPDDDDDGKKGKKAKASDDSDDDTDDEMRGNSAAAQARRREQARCAAIFASPAAAKNPVLAANLAFKSRMGRAEALALLESSPASAIGGHPDRSARNPRVGPDASADRNSRQAIAKSWDAVFSKANSR